jgi:flagellar protein FliS
MNQQAAQNYLKTTVLTASPEQLQLMLYDGALRFGEQARVALQARNYEQSCTMILRMQKIVAELTGALKPALQPELCRNMAALYNFIYRKLIDANMRHRVESLDEAMRTLRFQRDTWALLLEDLARKKAATAAAKMDIPAPSASMEASISMRG